MTKVLNAAGGYDLSGSRLQGLGTGTASTDAVTKAQLDGLTTFIKKTSDQSRQSTTSLADDSQLLLAVAANTTYRLYSLLIVNSPTAADFKLGWSGPSGATLEWSTNAPHTAQTNFDSSTISVNRLGIGSAADAAGYGADVIFQPSGFLFVGGTAGTLTFRWAQTTSTASDTTVKANSCLFLRKVA